MRDCISHDCPAVKPETTSMPDLPASLHLKITDLTITLADQILIQAFSADMSSGESWAILGPNGSGKTTLLQTIAGLHPFHSGDILLDRESIACRSSGQIALLRSILFQQTEDAFPATVMETVLSGRHPHIPYWQRESLNDIEIVRNALNRVDMAEFEDRDVMSLSGGERQRVSIAACLAQETPLRLYDEPANHLDMKHQDSILRLITENLDLLNLVVLQDINQAWRFCSHALLLYPDGTVETGSISEMLTIERLERLYDCDFKTIRDGEDRVFIHRTMDTRVDL